MRIVRVETRPRGYDIVVDAGLCAQIAPQLASILKNDRIFLITDENVAAHWRAPVEAACQAGGISVQTIVLPAGEATKSWASLEALTSELIQRGVERSDHLVALGGGVIGDLTGFAAAILKRGCGFIQIPTSLLAQVDSSVGGKTGINIAAGKNLVGAFNQPDLVLIDPEMLATLPSRDLRAGYAEVVKYGLIDQPDFFAWCEENGAALLDGDISAQTHAIVTSVAAKAAIVTDDERETSGRRALLNLGHTFGHALEAETGYCDKLVHGEAVAAGMALAFAYSVRRGDCSREDASRVAAHLAGVGLPHDLATAGVNASGGTLVAHMAHDKKMAAGRLPFLLARGIGQTFLAQDVEMDDVAAFLNAAR